MEAGDDSITADPLSNLSKRIALQLPVDPPHYTPQDETAANESV